MKCLPLAEGPREIARQHLADADNGWSIGTWGAIGEFQYDADEPGLILDLATMSVTSRRGALHIGDLSDAKLFALVDDAGRTREIAFCLPRPAAGRTTIYELDETTFDLGIGAPHVDMMVRLRGDDAETRAALREGLGRPLLAPAIRPVPRSLGRARRGSSPRRWRGSRSTSRSRRRAAARPRGRTAICCRTISGKGGRMPGDRRCRLVYGAVSAYIPGHALSALPRRPPWTTRPAPNSKPPPFAGWWRICSGARMCRISR